MLYLDDILALGTLWLLWRIEDWRGSNHPISIKEGIDLRCMIHFIFRQCDGFTRRKMISRHFIFKWSAILSLYMLLGVWCKAYDWYILLKLGWCWFLMVTAHALDWGLLLLIVTVVNCTHMDMLAVRAENLLFCQLCNNWLLEERRWRRLLHVNIVGDIRRLSISV